jgi:hypothetical protein
MVVSPKIAITRAAIEVLDSLIVCKAVRAEFTGWLSLDEIEAKVMFFLLISVGMYNEQLTRSLTPGDDSTSGDRVSMTLDK